MKGYEKLMKNKLFLLCSVPENQAEIRLFIARFERYLKQSKNNTPLLLVAALILASYQTYLNTPIIYLITWLLLFVFNTGIIYKIDHMEQQYTSNIVAQYKQFKAVVTRRSIYGLNLALLFGASCYLMPVDTPFDYLALYYIFLICLVAIILISNINFPEFYFAYSAIVVTMLFVHTWVYGDQHSDGFLVMASLIYPIGALIMAVKALEMSKSAINEIALRLILTKQMAEMLELQQVIKHQSEHDELTGLANRRKFEDRASELEHGAKVQEARFSLIYIDLDKFKPINDTFGHVYGDLVLQEMAKRLSSCSRKSDLVCRLGGDEFCVLVHDMSEAAELSELALTIESRLMQTFSIEGNDFNIGASIGTAAYPVDGASIDELVSFADKKMYAHKQQKLALI